MLTIRLPLLILLTAFLAGQNSPVFGAGPEEPAKFPESMLGVWKVTSSVFNDDNHVDVKTVPNRARYLVVWPNRIDQVWFYPTGRKEWDAREILEHQRTDVGHNCLLLHWQHKYMRSEIELEQKKDELFVVHRQSHKFGEPNEGTAEEQLVRPTESELSSVKRVMRKLRRPKSLILGPQQSEN